MSKRFAVFGALLIGVLAALGGIAWVGGSGSSAGGTLASGRSVTARSDSWSLSSTFSADTATIRTAGRSIEVAPDELRVDGQPVAAIDASAKSIEVIVQRGAITVVADGRTAGTYRQ